MSGYHQHQNQRLLLTWIGADLRGEKSRQTKLTHHLLGFSGQQFRVISESICPDKLGSLIGLFKPEIHIHRARWVSSHRENPKELFKKCHNTKQQIRNDDYS